MALDCDGGTITLGEIVDEINNNAKNQGGSRWSPTQTYQKGTLINTENTLPGGTVVQQEYISKIDNNTGNNPVSDPSSWKIYNVVKYIDEDLTITVGTGGDFATVNDAIDFYGRYSAINSANLYIKFVNSHTINYFVVIRELPLTNKITFISDGTPLTIDASICSDVDEKKRVIIIYEETSITFEDMTINFIGTYNVEAIYSYPFDIRSASVINCIVNYNIERGYTTNWQSAALISLGKDTVFNYNTNSSWNMVLLGHSYTNCAINGNLNNATRMIEVTSSGSVRNITGNYHNYQYGFYTQVTKDTIMISNCNFSGASRYGVAVDQGGMVFVHSSTTTFSQAPGVITNNGMIFDNGNNTTP